MVEVSTLAPRSTYDTCRGHPRGRAGRLHVPRVVSTVEYPSPDPECPRLSRFLPVPGPDGVRLPRDLPLLVISRPVRGTAGSCSTAPSPSHLPRTRLLVEILDPLETSLPTRTDDESCLSFPPPGGDKVLLERSFGVREGRPPRACRDSVCPTTRLREAEPGVGRRDLESFLRCLGPLPCHAPGNKVITVVGVRPRFGVCARRVSTGETRTSTFSRVPVV